MAVGGSCVVLGFRVSHMVCSSVVNFSILVSTQAHQRGRNHDTISTSHHREPWNVASEGTERLRRPVPAMQGAVRSATTKFATCHTVKRRKRWKQPGLHLCVPLSGKSSL